MGNYFINIKSVYFKILLDIIFYNLLQQLKQQLITRAKYISDLKPSKKIWVQFA